MSDTTETALTESTGREVRLIGFRGYRQALDTWCWAAIAASISLYYRKRRNPEDPQATPQCYFVLLQHPGPVCRRNLGRPAVDKEHADCMHNGCAIRDQPELGTARGSLDAPSLHVFREIVERPINFSSIVTEIEAGQPVAIRVRTRYDTHHLLAVYGYDAAVPSLIMWDPAAGERIVSYNALQRDLGKWTHTIFTKEPDDNTEPSPC